MEINKDLRVTDGNYYNLDLNTIAKSNIYSTDEIVVGRWINGKPIYRKVFSGSFANDYVLLTGVANLVSVTGTLDPGTGIQRTVPYYERYQDKNYVARVEIQSGNVRIDAYLASAEANANGTIAIEYTKTAD